ncbi:MAG: 6-bladed beta-propeller [Duncaniella sp.]|nr:6-bladed beta-propeller [Duncaniella sp.]
MGRLLIIFSLMAGCFFHSCTTEDSENDSIQVDFSDVDCDSVPLSQFIDSITYVTLELNDSLVFGRIKNVSFNDSTIVVLDNLTNEVTQFTHEGKFIRRIGSKGRGPGEFISATKLDSDDKHIYIYDRMLLSVLKYDHDGNYIDRDSIGSAEDFVAIGTNGTPIYLLALYNASPERSGIFLWNRDKGRRNLYGCSEDTPLNHPWEIFKDSDEVSVMTRDYENRIFNLDGDSLTIELDLKISPTPSKHDLNNWHPKNVMEYFTRGYYYNTSRWTICDYWRGDESRVVIIDKKTGHKIVTNKLYNDIDSIKAVQGLPRTVNNSLIFVVPDDEDDFRLQLRHLKR